MKTLWKVSSASVALVAMGAGAAPAFAQDAQTEADDGQISEIVVTATRREESANKIPVAIQALGGEALGNLNVSNFDDLVEYLPNVRAASRGPGTSSIYIRGLSTDTAGIQINGTAGVSPSVALYVNDAPASLVGRNLDIYAVDLQRVEVLAGPQGTLFGASAMGGAIRYITNKPNLEEMQAGINASYGFTKGGDESTGANGYVNIPVIKDRLAIRVALYADRQGGYIDNVRGEFQMPFNGNVGVAGRLPTGNPLLVMRALQSCQILVSPGVYGARPGCDGSNYNAPVRQKINNDAFVEDNYNDATYAGGRIAATFKVNDDWSIDLMHMRQQLDTDGVFDYEPAVGPLKVTQFGPNELKDKFNITTWAINGRLGMLDLIYTGSYLKHQANQVADYASYSNIGVFVPYYECDAGVYYNNPSYGNLGNTCYTPNKSYSVRNRTTRETHEFRVTTPVENRFRATAGLFYDTTTLLDNTDWSYLQEAAGFIIPRAPNPIVNANDPSVRPVKVGFFNDVTRKDRQLAIYGEASFDIIPDKLTITGGARYYDEKASLDGSSNMSFPQYTNTAKCPANPGGRAVYNAATGTYSLPASPQRYYSCSANLAETLAGLSPAKYNGFIFKGNLTYRFGDGSLVYATYSEGFRPGGFNRKPCNVATPACDSLKQYVPDEVKNYEIGGKFSLMNRRMQLNLAAYQIDWTNIQQTIFDQNISNQTFTTNFTNARIRGVEGDLTWRATPELTINTAFSYNDSELTKLLRNTSVLRPVGSPLAMSPKFQGNIRARYEWETSGGLRPFVQAGINHVGKSISSVFDNVDIRMPSSNATLGYVGQVPITYNGVLVRPGDVIVPTPASLEQKAYTMVNASIGASKDNWSIELFGENLTNARPELFKSGNDGELRVTTSRPLTVGLRIGYEM